MAGIALGGDWAGIKGHAIPLKAAIEHGRVWLDAKEVTAEIRKILDSPQGPGSFSRQLSEQITDILGSASPWDAVKKAGSAAIPAGDATRHYQELRSSCESNGCWIVPVGELEGFCRSQGGHGPRWVQGVLAHHDPATSSELAKARTFMQNVWKRIQA